jgi:hypothetical protein
VTEKRIEESRSAGVTAAATLGILCSVTCLLLWGRFFLSMMNLPPDSQGKHLYETHPLIFLTFTVIPPLLVALGLRTSIGLFHLSAWARRGALLWAVLAFVFASLIIAFQPYETFAIREEFVSAVASEKQLIAVAFVTFTFPLGAWWMFYFTRPHVIAQFEPPKSENSAPTAG